MGRLLAYFVKRFESDSRWAVRVAAAGGLGLVMAVYITAKGFRREGSAFAGAMIVGVLIGMPAFFVVGGVFLATADTIRRRLSACCSGRAFGPSLSG